MGMNRRWLIAIVLLCVSPGAILGGDPGKVAGPESSRLVGKLVVNAGKDSQASPYCVVDHWGAVVGKVSPAAGIDLGAYCNRTVTLVGTMVSTPQDAPPHLVATRVVGADLRFTLPVMGQAAREDGQSPVRPTAYQEPSVETLPPDSLQPKGDKTPSAGQRSLLNPPLHAGESAPPPAPLPGSPPASGSPPMLVSPLGPGSPSMLVSPMTPGSPPMLVTPLSPGSSSMLVSPVAPGSPMAQAPPPQPVPEPGPFPLPAQPAGSPDAGEPACGGCEFCCPRRSRVWGEVDYLVWWTSGMYVPPLVTEGSVNDAHPGALGQPGTTVLFGGDNILTDGRSGGMAKIGYWLNDCHTSGIEVEYLGLQDDTDPFHQWSSGLPVIARPFYDTSVMGQRSEAVAYPSLLAGSVSVDPRTDFQMAAARLRWEWFSQGSFCDPDDCSLCQWGRRVDVTFGYRYMQLNDGLDIREDLTTTNYTETVPPTPQGSSVVEDSFKTYNVFQGGELGLVFQTRQGRWSWELAPRIALGTTQESVAINGSTTAFSPAGVPSTPLPSGGLLALQSNIGERQRDVFAVVPQVALKLGYQLTPCLRVTTAYDFLYWSSVARAGNQIDVIQGAPAVNSTLLPGSPVPQSGPTAPTFAFHDSGFWAQGVSLGLDYRW